MPFYMAITAGALVGGAVAIVNKKEQILDAAETLFQLGAQYCKEQKSKIRQANMAYATNHEDSAFADYEYDQDTEYEKTYGQSSSATRSHGNGKPIDSGFSSEMTTPDISDNEQDDESDTDYDLDLD